MCSLLAWDLAWDSFRDVEDSILFHVVSIYITDTKANVVSEIEVTDLEACEVLSQVSYMQVV